MTLLETEFSRLLGATTQKISQLAEARRVARSYGFRVVLYGGASREIIDFVYKRINVLGSARAYSDWLEKNEIHWLDWHRVGSDIDLLAIPMHHSTALSELSPQIAKIFRGRLFYSKVEFGLADDFFRSFPLENNHYEPISNIPISECGVELLPAQNIEGGINLAIWGLEQFEKRQFDFRVKEKLLLRRFPYDDFRRVLRWIRYAGEYPNLSLNDSSREAIQKLMDYLKPQEDELLSLLRTGQSSGTFGAVLIEAMNRIHRYTRNPPYTKELLLEFGISELFRRANLSEKIGEPLENHSLFPKEKGRLGTQMVVYYEAPLSVIQNFSWGALWRSGESGKIVVKRNSPCPEWGTNRLAITLSADALLGVDLKQNGEEFELLTLNAIEKIGLVTPSSVRNDLANQIKICDKIKFKG